MIVLCDEWTSLQRGNKDCSTARITIDDKHLAPACLKVVMDYCSSAPAGRPSDPGEEVMSRVCGCAVHTLLIEMFDELSLHSHSTRVD